MQALVQRAFHSYEDVRTSVAAGHYVLKNRDDQVILPEVWEDIVEPGFVVEIEIRQATDDEASDDDEDEDVHVYEVHDSIRKSAATSVVTEDVPHVSRYRTRVEEDETEEDQREALTSDLDPEERHRSDSSENTSAKANGKPLRETRASSSSSMIEKPGNEPSYKALPIEILDSNSDYDASTESDTPKALRKLSATNTSVSRESKPPLDAGGRRRKSVKPCRGVYNQLQTHEESIIPITTQGEQKDSSTTAAASWQQFPIAATKALQSLKVWFVLGIVFLFGE